VFTSERSLASLKAKESSATTLLIGVTSMWILVAGNNVPLLHRNNDVKSLSFKMYRYGSVCEDSSKGSTVISIPTQPMYAPKTAFVKKLMELRTAAIERGMSLMTLDEINEEVEKRRGSRA
jgi:hypothetical protein